MLELCSIASGSSGNCIYAGAQNSHILIDAGISGRRIEKGLENIGLKAEEIQAILITHEHIDHVAGIGVLARRYGIPMYATPETITAIGRMRSLGKIDEDLFRPITDRQEFTIGELSIKAIPISHDAAHPVMYKMTSGGRKMAVATDMGTYNEETIQELSGLDLLLLEANHDIRMLQTGPYPYPLKQRILSDRGHLSNERSGELLGKLLHDGFGAVMLGHLSKENNYEKLAYETVRLEVDMGDNPYRGDDFPLYVAKRDQISPVLRAQ